MYGRVSQMLLQSLPGGSDRIAVRRSSQEQHSSLASIVLQSSLLQFLGIAECSGPTCLNCTTTRNCRHIRKLASHIASCYILVRQIFVGLLSVHKIIQCRGKCKEISPFGGQSKWIPWKEKSCTLYGLPVQLAKQRAREMIA